MFICRVKIDDYSTNDFADHLICMENVFNNTILIIDCHTNIAGDFYVDFSRD